MFEAREVARRAISVDWAYKCLGLDDIGVKQTNDELWLLTRGFMGRPRRDESPLIHLQKDLFGRLLKLDRERSLEVLHLSPRAVHILALNGIETIGALINSAKTGLTPVQTTLTKSVAEINDALAALARSIQGDGRVDWIGYASDRGFLILPYIDLLRFDPERYFEIFPEVLRTAILSRFRPSVMFAFEQHLMRESPMNLGQIGNQLGQTRQGAASLKDKALKMLRESIFEDRYSGCSFRFRSSFVEPLRRLRDSLKADRYGIQSRPQWEEMVARLWGISRASLKRHQRCLLSILDRQIRSAPSRGQPMPIVLPKTERTSEFRRIVQRSSRLLRFDFPAGLSRYGLLQKLHSMGETALTIRELPSVIDSIPGVEWVEREGIFRIRTERLHRMSDQLERILSKRGVPMRPHELALELIQFRRRGGSKRWSEHVRGALSDDARFACIGRIGLWGLSKWNFETGTIADVSAKLLRECNRPMTEEELYPLIIARRPVKQHSIASLLRDDGRFRRTAPRMWDLKERFVKES